MDRRNFLRFLSTGSAVAVAPSLVWPFRKIFLPAIYPAPWGKLNVRPPDIYDQPGIFAGAEITYLAAIRACELEKFAKGLPNINSEELKNSFDLFQRSLESYA
jgi:hypothetical protein